LDLRCAKAEDHNRFVIDLLKIVSSLCQVADTATAVRVAAEKSD